MTENRTAHPTELRLVALERDLIAHKERVSDRWERDEKIKTKEEEALKLQATEYERRLEDLNNAHQLAIEVQKAQVRAETFSRFEQEYRDWREKTDRRLNLQEGRSGISSALLMLVAGLGGGIVVFIVELLIKK